MSPRGPERWERNKIITMDKSDNQLGSFTYIQCCCGRSFTTVKGMRIHRTKMGCLCRQPRKSQTEISKSIEGNHFQENYHSTTFPFGYQPNILYVRKCAIRINWQRTNDAKWKTPDEELSFILRTNLKGSVGMKLHSFTNIVHAVCLENFGSENQQNHKRTANKRQREKGQLRFEKRRLKKRLKETPGNKSSIKLHFSNIKEKILVISRAENTRKRWLKKEKEDALSKKKNI